MEGCNKRLPQRPVTAESLVHRGELVLRMALAVSFEQLRHLKRVVRCLDREPGHGPSAFQERPGFSEFQLKNL
ncbi:MAG: hypothetical protein CMF59_00275 [Leptospiraceae bacterium]|nr:hypothetical protein [Leptospiraceae bacterium]